MAGQAEARGGDVMVVSFKVPFVKGKQRPRFFNGHVYTPRSTQEAEEAIRRAFLAAGGIKAPKGVTVCVHITTMRPLPKTTPKSVESAPDLGRPDIDNISKLVLDALNGTAYVDDSQVTELVVGKCDRFRGVEPATWVYVSWEA